MCVCVCVCVCVHVCVCVLQRKLAFLIAFLIFLRVQSSKRLDFVWGGQFFLCFTAISGLKLNKKETKTAVD